MSCCIVFCPPFYAAAYAQGTPWVGKIDDSLFIFWGNSCCYLLKLRRN